MASMFPYRGGQFGMELPEELERRKRWAEGAPRMAMALSEAGYPTRFDVWSFTTGRENELAFEQFPPDDVLLRAARLCGVEDMVQEALDAGLIKRASV